MTFTPLGWDQDCSLKIREPDVLASSFLDPRGWSKTAAVNLYFIFPGICTLSLRSFDEDPVRMVCQKPEALNQTNDSLQRTFSYGLRPLSSITPPTMGSLKFTAVVLCLGDLVPMDLLKSILFDIRIATPACFLSPFDWKAFSQPFTLSGLIIMCARGFFWIQSIWCSVGFLNLHRVSITFCKSLLVMNSASSALVCSGLAVGEPAVSVSEDVSLVPVNSLSLGDLASSDCRLPSPPLNGSQLNWLISVVISPIPVLCICIAASSFELYGISVDVNMCAFLTIGGSFPVSYSCLVPTIETLTKTMDEGLLSGTEVLHYQSPPQPRGQFTKGGNLEHTAQLADRVSPCSFDACPGSFSVDQAGLTLIEIHLTLPSSPQHWICTEELLPSCVEQVE
ncbi:hypothetical protein STEG23_022235, partial [Scotinomys teguina]